MKKSAVRVLRIVFAIGILLYLSQTFHLPALSTHAEAFPTPPSKNSELRNREAQKVIGIFETLSARSAEPAVSGPTYRISESELNSYLSSLMEKENIAGLEAFFVRLSEGAFTTYAIINVDSIPRKDKDTATRLLMETLLAGKQHISAEGTLTAHNGLGEYILTAAHMDQATLPAGIINVLIRTIGAKQTPPFDITKPFRLPFRIREARIAGGYLEIS